MSNLQRKANALYGIIKWLEKQGYNYSYKIINKILIEFLKSKNIPYIKPNPKYKGLFTSDICNAEKVQLYFNEFTKFIKDNYSNKSIS